MNVRSNAYPDPMAEHDRIFANMAKQRDREERKQEVVSERLRLDIISVAQQLTGLSVICTFNASMTVALIALAYNMFSSRGDDWSQGQIYFLWYLSLIYSFTIAIASGASAVFAFAHANGRIDAESKGRVTANRDRMSRLVLGYAVCFGISVVPLFLGLLFFIWSVHDQSVTVMAGIAAVPLWVWVTAKICFEWKAVAKWETGRTEGGNRAWWIWTEFPWPAVRRRRTETEKEIA